MSRKKVDLRTLPGWLQYVIVLLVVALVALIAWLAQGGSPPSAWIGWINEHLNLLGWIYIAAVVLLVARWILGERHRRR